MSKIGLNGSVNSIVSLATLTDVVNEFISRHINLDAPEWYINPDFKIVLSSTSGVEVRAATPLKFAPGLLDVLRSDTPPSTDFFAALPRPEGKFWGVYVALLVKDGSEPGVCIGSGTETLRGYRSRVSHYSDKKHRMLPRHVRALYDKGYDLAHVGLLCWTPTPPVSIVPRSRMRLLAVEAVFTNIFYSVTPTCMDELWADMMPWTRDAVSWLPLNNHTPFKEAGAGDLGLTAAQLVRREKDRKVRAKHHWKKAYAKNAQAMREQYDRERAEDIEAFRAKKRVQAISWISRNKSRVNAFYARSKKKAVAEQRFYCETCQKAFADSTKLKRHNNSTRHQNKVAGRPSSAKALESQKYAARVIAEKRFHCATCNQSFDGAYHLDAHKLTQKHLAKLASVDLSTSPGSDLPTST